jgi:hypothetical protein
LFSAPYVQWVFLAQVDSNAIYGNKWKLLQALEQSGGPQAGLAHINLPGNGKKPGECINSQCAVGTNTYSTFTRSSVLNSHTTGQEIHYHNLMKFRVSLMYSKYPTTSHLLQIHTLTQVFWGKQW